MNPIATVFIGLGSNLNCPEEQIQNALNALSQLPDCSNLQCAPWYTSKAIGPKGQPDYINTVVSLQTTLPALDLLHALQKIENQQGRQRTIRWGARTLDLDLLLYNNTQLNTDELTLPHPEIQNRSFVLLPLYDLTPELILSDGSALSDLVELCDKSELTMIRRSEQVIIEQTGLEVSP